MNIFFYIQSDFVLDKPRAAAVKATAAISTYTQKKRQKKTGSNKDDDEDEKKRKTCDVSQLIILLFAKTVN